MIEIDPLHTCEHLLNAHMVKHFGCPRSKNAHIERKKCKCDYILDISSRQELRKWYEANHTTCKEFWVRVNRGKNDVTGIIPYVDSVEVALCFGWIDSTLKHIDDGYPVQRFSPRRKGGNWCERNIERCKRLVASREMTPAGLQVIPDDIKATF